MLFKWEVAVQGRTAPDRELLTSRTARAVRELVDFSFEAQPRVANASGFQELWRANRKVAQEPDVHVRNKYVILGFTFLKYISDAFEEMHACLEADRTQGADLMWPLRGADHRWHSRIP